MKYKIALRMYNNVMKTYFRSHDFLSENCYKDHVGIHYRNKDYRSMVHAVILILKRRVFGPVRWASENALSVLNNIIHNHPVYKSFFENLRKVE